MTFIGNLKKSWGRARHNDDTHLQGDMILSEIMKEKSTSPVQKYTPVKSGHEEKAKKSLESIYAIETVDVKSVRPLTQQEEPFVQDPSPIEPKTLHPQLELELGDRFRGGMESFVSQQPLYVLELSPPTASVLRQNGKTRLGDLIGLHYEDYLNFKGLAHSSIEEVEQKLSKYCENHNLESSQKIDFMVLLRVLLPQMKLKEIQVTDELVSALKEKQEDLIQHLLRIVDVFVLPWVEYRGGIVTEDEIEERLERVCMQGTPTHTIITLFKKVCGQEIWSQLVPIDDKTYAIDTRVSDRYHSLISHAKSFFYREDCRYPFHKLMFWLEQEFARNWESYPASFIEKSLTVSSAFALYKNEDHERYVRLA